MSKLLADRKLGTVVTAVLHVPHYRAVANMFLRYEHPMVALQRYLFGWGEYPYSLRLNTPLGRIEPVLYSHDDILTLNEIFCRGDYRCPSDVRTIVDFGSNIGLSALYFLTLNRNAFAYLFEPLPGNVGRLRKNLRGFENRYECSEVAVALADGEADFGFEESGRYGGIGLAREKTIRVPCRAANGILNDILARRGEIDVLKIDIESLEREILLGIPCEILKRLGNIFVEVDPMFKKNPLPLTHHYRRYGTVARFSRRAQ